MDVRLADNVGAHQRRTGVFEMLCAVRHVGSIPCVRRKLPRALRTMTAVYLQETAGRVRVRFRVALGLLGLGILGLGLRLGSGVGLETVGRCQQDDGAMSRRDAMTDLDSDM